MSLDYYASHRISPPWRLPAFGTSSHLQRPEVDMGVLTCMAALALLVQQTAAIQLIVTAEKQPVPGAQVIVAGDTATTDAEGRVLLKVAAGLVEITVVKERFNPVTVTATVVAERETAIEVTLERQAAIEEEVTVSATRTD